MNRGMNDVEIIHDLDYPAEWARYEHLAPDTVRLLADDDRGVGLLARQAARLGLLPVDYRHPPDHTRLKYALAAN